MLQRLKLLGSAGSLPLPPCGCDRDPVEALKVLFVDESHDSLAAGRDPATRRPLRLHGVARGNFTVNAELPIELHSVGLFAKAGEYPVWVRLFQRSAAGGS